MSNKKSEFFAERPSHIGMKLIVIADASVRFQKWPHIDEVVVLDFISPRRFVIGHDADVSVSNKVRVIGGPSHRKFYQTI